MSHIECHIDNNIAILELNRSTKANAYTPSMLTAMDTCWDRIEQHARIAIIQSTGDGAFCGGADLVEMNNVQAEDALDLFSQRLFNRIATSKVISIAAIHGAAIAGGFELTLACDLRVASKNAWFALPEVSKGLIPAAGGCTRLTTLMGPSISKGVILGNAKIMAAQALQWGLLHRIDDNPRGNAFDWAQDLITRNPLALRLAKQVLQAPSLEKERLAEALLYEQKTHGNKHTTKNI